MREEIIQAIKYPKSPLWLRAVVLLGSLLLTKLALDALFPEAPLLCGMFAMLVVVLSVGTAAEVMWQRRQR